MQTARRNRNDEIIQTVYATGTGALTTTLSNTAVADLGNGQVRLAIAADIYDAPSLVYIEGTTNYDGLRKIAAAPAGFIDIYASYLAETPAGTETVKIAYAPDSAVEIKALTLKLSAVPAGAENLTISIDDGLGATYDVQIHQVDLNGVTAAGYIWTPTDKLIAHLGDVIRLVWANGDGRTYGLKLHTEKIQA